MDSHNEISKSWRALAGVLTEASSRMADIAKRRKLEEQVIHMER
jgi:hypothetical protein